jgi:hypothetical protein
VRVTNILFAMAAVRTRGVRRLLTLATPDDPRLEAQPLYVSGIVIGGYQRNVIYQATMENMVYARDADTGVLLWSAHLGTPINGSPQIDSHNINVKWGILSTPVIDRQAGILYACASTSPDHSGRWQTGQFFAAAIDLVTGALVKPLLSPEGATYHPGHSAPPQRFNSTERKQRAALALTRGAVIIYETAQSGRGWIIAVDTASWTIAATWCSTSRGSGASRMRERDLDNRFTLPEHLCAKTFNPPGANASSFCLRASKTVVLTVDVPVAPARKRGGRTFQAHRSVKNCI